MEIKSFDKYHLGIKLNPNINMGEIKLSLLKLDGSNDFRKIDNRNKLNPPNLLDMQNFVIEELLEKGDVKIHFHVPLQALNFVGKNPKEVTEVFSEVMEFLFNKEQYEEQALVVFYETIAEIVINNSIKPLEVLEKVTTINTASFESLGDLVVKSITLGNDTENQLTVIISPHPTRPNKDFLAQVIKRDKTKKEASQNYIEISKSIINLLLYE